MPGGTALPAVGDRIVAVNGMAVEDWEAAARAYMRHSTVAGLRWKLAEAMTTATALFPPSLRGGDAIVLTVRPSDGTEVTFDLPVRQAGELAWQGVSEPAYPGFESVLETITFELLVDDVRRVAVLVWTGFRETMVEDVDALLQLAEERGILDYALVVDVTRSGGGSHLDQRPRVLHDPAGGCARTDREVRRPRRAPRQSPRGRPRRCRRPSPSSGSPA